MTRKALYLAFLLMVPAMAAMTPMALAQTHRFEITPTASYRFNGEFEANSDFPVDDDLDVRIDEGAAFGVIFDVPLNPNWQLEFIANRQDSTFVVDEGLFTPETELGDVAIDYYHAGFLVQWGPGQVNGFVSAGLGFARVDPDFPELETETRFSGNLGGGVKVFLAENVGLRVEGRGYWVDLESGFEGRYDRFDSDEGLFQGEVSAGLILSW